MAGKSDGDLTKVAPTPRLDLPQRLGESSRLPAATVTTTAAAHRVATLYAKVPFGFSAHAKCAGHGFTPNYGGKACLHE